MSEKRDSFCVLLWNGVDISRMGVARPCCTFKGAVKEWGREVRVGETHTLKQVLESRPYQKMRAAALAGQEIPSCARCYKKERDGAVSDRQIYNNAYRHQHQIPENVSLRDHFASGAAGAPHLVNLSVQVGSACNLKCRMCGPYVSSRIATDVVHTRWSRLVIYGRDNYVKPKPEEVSLRDEVLFGDIFGDLSTVEHIQLSGGEPFAVVGIDKALQRMVDSGDAKRIELSFPSNGTLVTDETLEILRQFKAARIRLSVDGFGPADEYVRFPTKWPVLQDAAEKLRTLTNADLAVGFTLSAYNVFEPAKVAAWAAGLGLAFEWGCVERPWHLSPGVLPASVLHQAAAAARAGKSGLPDRAAAELEAVAQRMEALATSERPEEFDTFVEFTNDLDASRNQDLQAALPDLAAALEKAVGPWDKSRHRLFAEDGQPLVQVALPAKHRIKKKWGFLPSGQ